jgi:hypothetical protein
MALTAYEVQVRRLLQNPSAPSTLYLQTDIDSYINTARGQVAGEGEAIRYLATLSTVMGTNNYTFASVNTGTSSVTGIAGIINIRSMWYGVGSGKQWVTPRPWEWFGQFNFNTAVPVNGAPVTWSQFAQGAAPNTGGTASAQSAFGGSFYIDPVPDQVYTLYLDCVCFPIALVNDTTVEALPYLWTDAVPFYAAYYALLSAQMQARRADAEAYFNFYETFIERARRFSNPTVNRYQYEQAGDATRMNKLGSLHGIMPGQGGGSGGGGSGG